MKGGEKGSVVEERIYLGGVEIYRRYISGALDFERETLNISDTTKTVARLETTTFSSGSEIIPDSVIRYQYDNHLGSACLELDQNAAIISYEEYHPFGTTSYRSGKTETEVSLKRYKYVGKERDEETGLYYYGARYYAGWLGRFVSVDAMAGKFPFYTPYQYSGNNPISFYDLDGNEQVDNTETNVEQNGQQNKMSIEQKKPTLDENGNIINKTKEVASVTRNEDGTYTLNYEVGTQFFENGEPTENFSYERFSETADSYESFSEAGRNLIDQLITNFNSTDNSQSNTVLGNTSKEDSSGTMDDVVKNVNKVSNIVGTTASVAKEVAQIPSVGYTIAYSPKIVSSVNYLKPIANAAAGISILADVYLTYTGQQSLEETVANTIVTGVAIGAGGWAGVVIQLDYQAAKYYTKTTRKHPEWVMPASYHSFTH